MTPALILTPRDRRSAAFFWLGVGVFPVFWSWFTLEKRFAKWQRYLALGWLLVVACAFATTLPQMSERYFLMSLGLPVICHELAFWLWIWLVLRIVPLHQLLSLFVVLITPIAQVRSLYCPVAATIPSQDFSLYWAFMPLIPALLHLAVEPARAGLKRLDQTPMNIRLFWIFTAALPAFFVWFTICRYFTRRERVIAWSWAAIHTTFFLVVYPHAVFLSPLSVLMAFVALQQWWSERSKADSDDSA